MLLRVMWEEVAEKYTIFLSNALLAALKVTVIHSC